MKDERKTKKQLLEELKELRHRIKRLEAPDARSPFTAPSPIHPIPEKQIGKTEAVRNAGLLRQTYQKYQNIFENIQNIYCEITPDGIISEISPSVREITNYRREELIGKSLTVFLDDPHEWKKIIHHLVLHGKLKDYELHLKNKWGASMFFLTTAQLITDTGGKSEKIIATLSDITRRKQAETAYKNSEARMRRILDASIDAIRQVDKDLRVIWANKASIAVSNTSLEQILGRTCYKFFTDRDQPCEGCPAIKAKKTGQVERAVMYKPRVRGLSGDTYWDLYCVPLKNESGEIDSYIQISKNITEEKRAEDLIQHLSQQLLQSQERERHMISCELHDRIAQDLAALKIGFDTLLDDQPKLHDELREKTRHLSGIINKTIFDIRNLSYELRPPDLDEIDIINVLKAYTEDFAEERHIKIDFQASSRRRLVLDSESKIHVYRLVQEGLINIYKHAQASWACVKVGLSPTSVSLFIKDNGIGFDVKERERKLNHEKRLGLRSMLERVKLLNGQMKIKSRPGEGTKIIIKFPFGDKAREAENTNINC